jgi:carboxypeptidase family protein
MKRTGPLLLCVIVCCFVGATWPRAAAARQATTLSGQIKLDNNTVPPRLTVRLYPKKESKRPTIVTYTDRAGRYRVANLSAGQYLLEVYQGEKMAFQKALDVRGGQQVFDITLKVRR